MTSAPRRRIFERLGFQLACLLAAVLLPLTMVSMWNSLRAVREMHGRAEAVLTGETMLAAANEIRLIEEARGSVAAIASLVGPLVSDDVACSAAMRAFAVAHPIYAQISFVPESGQVKCSSTGKQFDLSQSPVFRSILLKDHPGFSVIGFGIISGTSVLGISNPVYDLAGKYLGYVAISLPHSKLDITLASGGTNRPLDLVTFDRDGAVLVATMGLENAAASLPGDRSLQALMSDEPMAFEAQSKSGENRVFSVVPLVPGELYALGTWPADPTPSFNATLISVPFLAPALISIASLVVAWLSVEWLVNRPIRRLNGSINAFAKGDRQTTDVDVSGAPLEIREMAAAFELMTNSVTRDEAELEDTLHQKEVLLREVHHRVKNNLQMIASIMNMHGRKARTVETRQVIKGLQGRVMSLATIHRELYQTKGVGDVHAAELLDAIARQTVNVAAGPDRRFDLQLHLNDIRMTPDQAVPLALLVGEGLMNAVACARTTAPDVWPLNLRLTQTAPDAATLQIEGFAGEGAESVPEAMEESYSLSGQLMTVFALQLGGKLEQTVAQGKYNMRVDFQLRPLVEGEDRHAVHAPEPV
jgi:two-component sensor histidine kinase